MAQIPANPKLWAMIVAQARAKFATYPSPGASHWVHKEYVNHGGHFREGSSDTSKQARLSRQFQEKRRKILLERKQNKSDKKKGEK
jgi:hypothetical protein